MRNKGMQLHLFLVPSVFSSWPPPFLLLSNSYPLQFTWRVCGPVPLYLHVRGGCVSSWTVCLNLKQPRDTLLIWRWQLYCLRRHNTPPLNVTPLGLPKHNFPISLFPLCWWLISAWVWTSSTTGSCQHACSLLGTCLHSSSVAVLQHLTTGTASKNQLHHIHVLNMKCRVFHVYRGVQGTVVVWGQFSTDWRSHVTISLQCFNNESFYFNFIVNVHFDGRKLPGLRNPKLFLKK